MLAQDIRYAVRQLAKSPGFTAVAVLTLALGIGANTMIFSIIDSTIINPLPFPDADRLVYLWRTHEQLQVMTTPSFEEIELWREQVDGFEQVEAMSTENLTLTDGDHPVRVIGARVSTGFLDFLGAEPMLGRGLDPGEVASGDAHVVLLGAGLWKSRFASDPAIIAREIRLDGQLYTVIGIMPPWFHLQFPFSDTQLWLPVAAASETMSRGAQGIARLREGVGIEAVNEELAALATDPDGDGPAAADAWKGQARDPGEMLGRRSADALWAFQGAVAFVLLIAAANVANLLLARGTSRRRELAIRAAIGAGRGRLVRQLMTESLLLAIGGGTLGLLIARSGIDVIRWLKPEDMNNLETMRMHPRMLAMAAALTILTGLVFGLLPAMQTAGRRLLDSLADGAPGAGGGRSRLRQALVIAEVSLSMVLLVGAGLLISSFLSAQAVDPGFDPEGLLAIQLHLQDNRYVETEQRTVFWDALQEALVARLGPGATHTAFSSGVPPRGGIQFGAAQIEGHEAPPESTHQDSFSAALQVAPGYFEAMRIPLLGGRDFDPGDRDSADNPLILNEGFASELFSGDDPVGRRLRFGERGEWHTVVGVVGNIKALGLIAMHGDRQVYYPHTGDLGDWIVIRADGDPLRHVAAVRGAVASIDPDVPLTEIRLATEMLGDSIATSRFNAGLMTVFAGVALVLALTGIYGVLSYSVAQRTREIGVRMALGSPRSSVLRLVARSGLGLILIGLAIGTAGAAAVARLLGSLLFGVAATDPLTYAVVALVLAATGAAATLVPARRATRVDPLIALRAD